MSYISFQNLHLLLLSSLSPTETYSASTSRNLRNSGAWGYQTEDVSSSVSTTIKGNHREQTLLQLINKEKIMHNKLTGNTFIQREFEKLNKMG